MFSYDSLIPEIIFYKISKEGNLLKETRVHKDRVTMIHDFSLTKTTRFFLSCPVFFDKTLKKDFVIWKPEKTYLSYEIKKKLHKAEFLCTTFHIAHAQGKRLFDYRSIVYKKFWSLNNKSKKIPTGTLKDTLNLKTKAIKIIDMISGVEFPVYHSRPKISLKKKTMV